MQIAQLCKRIRIRRRYGIHPPFYFMCIMCFPRVLRLYLLLLYHISVIFFVSAAQYPPDTDIILLLPFSSTPSPRPTNPLFLFFTLFYFLYLYKNPYKSAKSVRVSSMRNFWYPGTCDVTCDIVCQPPPRCAARHAACWFSNALNRRRPL